MARSDARRLTRTRKALIQRVMAGFRPLIVNQSDGQPADQAGERPADQARATPAGPARPAPENRPPAAAASTPLVITRVPDVP